MEGENWQNITPLLMAENDLWIQPDDKCNITKRNAVILSRRMMSELRTMEITGRVHLPVVIESLIVSAMESNEILHSSVFQLFKMKSSSRGNNQEQKNCEGIT